MSLTWSNGCYHIPVALGRFTLDARQTPNTNPAVDFADIATGVVAINAPNPHFCKGWIIAVTTVDRVASVWALRELPLKCKL